MRDLRLFQRLCGQEVLENVLLTTTQWSNVDPVEGQAHEDNLRDEGLWGGLIGEGATVRRFNGTRESGLELIRELMSHKTKPLRIQDQIVRQHMTLPETDAGKFLNEELAAQEKGFKEELESLGNKLRETIRANDGGMNLILIIGAEKARAREGLKKAEAERGLLEGLDVADIGKAGPSRQPINNSGKKRRPVTMYSPPPAWRNPEDSVI